MRPTTSTKGGERCGSPCFPCGSPGIAHCVQLQLSRRMLKKYLGTSGAPCAAMSCHKHITSPAHCVTAVSPRAEHRQGSPGTAALCSGAGAAAGDKRARRSHLTFTNRSCHSLLGVFWAPTGKTSRPVSSGTNWWFPALEAFIAQRFSLHSVIYMGWTLPPLPQPGTNGVHFPFLFLWNPWKIKTFARASYYANSPASAGFCVGVVLDSAYQYRVIINVRVSSLGREYCLITLI